MSCCRFPYDLMRETALYPVHNQSLGPQALLEKREIGRTSDNT